MATSFKMNTFLNNSYHKDYYLQRSSFEFFVLPICLFTLVKVLVKQEGRKIEGFPLWLPIQGIFPLPLPKDVIQWLRNWNPFPLFLVQLGSKPSTSV